MQHILLQKSKRYSDPVVLEVPDNYSYDSKKGYWIEKSNGKPMMIGDKPPIQNSKKWDRETGEDQKGE